MTETPERLGTNPFAEIMHTKVQALAKLGDAGRWQGVIAHTDDHPTLARVRLLETLPMYSSEQEAKTAMGIEINRILDAVEAIRAAEQSEGCSPVDWSVESSVT